MQSIKLRCVLVFRLLLLLVFEPATLEGVQVTAALETDGGDQSLNLGPAAQSKPHRATD